MAGSNDVAIHVEGLWKSLGGVEVLRGVDLTVRRGETLVVIGRSGGGKSGLLKHVIGLLRPDRGRVLVEGEEVGCLTKAKLGRLRLRFGMLFQGAALFDSLSVAENVGLGLKEHRRLPPEALRRRVGETLAMVGLAGAEELRPAELSGGMRKRVGLARALAADPRFVLYDEPTTGLDPITADVINELIRGLSARANITSIAVTHDMTSAYRIGDRIAMLHEGRIIFTGTVEETRSASDPAVRQFIEGRAEGPIPPL